MICHVTEDDGRTAYVTGMYPSAAATNYAAVIEPEPMHQARYVTVRLWPFAFLRRGDRFGVVNHGTSCCAYEV